MLRAGRGQGIHGVGGALCSAQAAAGEFIGQAARRAPCGPLCKLTGRLGDRQWPPVAQPLGTTGPAVKHLGVSPGLYRTGKGIERLCRYLPFGHLHAG